MTKKLAWALWGLAILAGITAIASASWFLGFDNARDKYDIGILTPDAGNVVVEYGYHHPDLCVDKNDFVVMIDSNGKLFVIFQADHDFILTGAK